MFLFQRCYSETEDECEHLRATSEETAGKLQELATKHTELLEQVQQLNAKLSEAETVSSLDILKIPLEKIVYPVLLPRQFFCALSIAKN